MATVRSLSGNDAFIEALQQTVTFAFQPIVDLRTGETHGVEALIRNLDKLGFQSIPAFFDYAWSAGILTHVDFLIRSLALTQVSNVAALSGRKVFLNVDARIMADRDGHRVRNLDVLRKTGLASDQIVLESRFQDAGQPFSWHDGEPALCRENGYGLAIDDFGRGIGELRVCYTHAPKYVKIDPHFATESNADRKRRPFIQALVDFTHALKAQAIAKGIETARDAAVFRDAGCDYAQGFWIAHPTTDHDKLRAAYPHVCGKT